MRASLFFRRAISRINILGFAGLFLAGGTASAGPFETHRLSAPGDFVTFSGYAASPESPDGSTIAYTKFIDKPTDDGWKYKAELWLMDHDGTNRRKLASTSATNAHNGVEFQWVDETRLVANQIKHDGKSGVAVIDTRTGKVVHGPIHKARIQHEPHDGQALLNVNQAGGDLARGIHKWDTATGKTTRLVTRSDFEPYKNKIKGHTDPVTWTFAHAEWAPTGKRWAVVLFVGDPNDPADSSNRWRVGNQFFLKPNGDIERLFGSGGKLNHPSFYDDTSIYGESGNKTVRAALDGTVIETAAGKTSHPSLAPDKQAITAERRKNGKVQIVRYPYGSENAQVIDEHPHEDVIWDIGAHTNASYSFDGDRIYYLKGNDQGNTEIWYAELKSDEKASASGQDGH